MNYKRPLLLIAFVFVLGVCVTAREAGLFPEITAGVLFSGILFHGLKSKRLKRGAATLLFVMFISGVIRYQYSCRTIDNCQKRIAAFEDLNVSIKGTVISHTSGSKSEKIVLKDALLSSAYGSSETLPADASEKMRKRYDQPVGTVMVYLSKQEDSDAKISYSDNQISQNTGVVFSSEEDHPPKDHQTSQTDNSLYTTDTGPFPGEIVKIYGTVIPPEGVRNEGQFDFELYYRTLGISGSLYGDCAEVIGGEPEPFKAGLQRFRNLICGQLDEVADETDSGIYKAILVGEKSEMNEEIRDLYQDMGIAHILAVSGLHLSIIGAGFYDLLRRFGASKKIAGVGGAMLILSYGIFTGSSGSAIRAVIMLLMKFLGAAIGRSYDMLTALALSCILLVMDEPYIIFSSGFQLSFMAVFALGIGNLLPHPKNSFLNGVYMSLFLQIMTLPVILYHFFRFPLYGLLLNLIVLPLMSYVVYSGLLAVTLSFFSVMLGIASIGFGHYTLRFYNNLCIAMKEIPYSSLLLGRPDIRSIIVYYSLLSILILTVLYMKTLKKKNLMSRQTKHLYSIMPKIAVLVILTGCFLLIRKPPSGLEITAIDVGQGDGLVIRYEDMVITVDGGSTSEKKLSEDMLIPYFESQGIDLIDITFITHCDSDHYSGILYLLEESDEIQIKELVLPLPAESDERYEKLKNAALAKDTQIRYFGAGSKLKLKDLELTGLYPLTSEYIEEANSHSIGMLLNYRNFSMLFTGDMDKECEYKMLDYADGLLSDQIIETPDIDILKVGHHGSSTSTSEELLDFMTPEVAIMSYGNNNRYGHPHKETLEILKSHDVKILETVKNGEVQITSDGKSYKVIYPINHNKVIPP
ncbi:competence protein ComEC [Oribacterium sp. KHPX15]|uniref:DNA internalization-related competence protein ComEC/Rec2 n=1 Tax=Oribacterium sp. KHPX15 TaxID=1855342 RepID=UPI00089B7A9D|nr:DNA internalization-related competence protein ComEC/Rec2 [Oribacterium sp. KHPX15]SDZ79289.1 competence protein ComEC [Oribacterium sp. KHPX15]